MSEHTRGELGNGDAGADSQDNFQPQLRRRSRLRIGSTQGTDDDSDLNNQPLAANHGLPQRRSVDVFPLEDEDEQPGMADDPEPGEIIILNIPPPHMVEEEPEIVAEDDGFEGAEEQQQEQQPPGVAPQEEVQAQLEQPPASQPSAEPNVINVDTPSPPKKRKRTSDESGTPVAKSGAVDDDEDDDGMTCSICLDSWEMSGEHRLVSLRCGHLFGESCIRRWMKECMHQTSTRVCPQCKAKATPRDVRHIYAKRLRAIDRSEEHRLRKELEEERTRGQATLREWAALKCIHGIIVNQVRALEVDNERLREIVRAGGTYGAFMDTDLGKKRNISELPLYRLNMEKNFELSKDPGSRVIQYLSNHSTLVASQKSSQVLFQGYGLRLIDAPTFKPTHFLHTSHQIVRDISPNVDQNLLGVACRENRVKLFDIRSRNCSTVFSANGKTIWTCAFDRKDHEHILYLGDLRGTSYVYDIRFPDAIISEFNAEGNFSPAIQIVPVPGNKDFEHGGFLVCQLSALTFYEYNNETATPHRLEVEGPFLSIQYDALQEMLLIVVRSNAKNVQGRFFLCKLVKIGGVPMLETKYTIFGSTVSPVMTRSALVNVESNSLVVGYLQDTKQLMMHDVVRNERRQTLPVNEVVFDVCPIRMPSNTYMAALTDNKCRIYKLGTSGAAD